MNLAEFVRETREILAIVGGDREIQLQIHNLSTGECITGDAPYIVWDETHNRVVILGKV